MAKKKTSNVKSSKGLTDKTPEAYEFQVYPPGTLRLDQVDLESAIEDDDVYEEKLDKLQYKVYGEQIRLFQEKRRCVLVFEGWDAAGKGGAIRRLTALMDPRGFKVWPISAPKDRELRNHYLWRFWVRMPQFGELAIFDRSWYGRVLVERVEGFATEREWQRAYDEINAFERMLTEDGVLMAKFFVDIDKKTQLQRFRAREKDPIKRYKITPDDWRNREKWGQYARAIQDMLDRTHRPDAPWHIIPGNSKKYARIAVLEAVLKLLQQ